MEQMFKNGGISSKTENGKHYYALAPLVVGMYEMQHHRLTPDFIKNFNAYTNERNFGLAFLSTERPQMRTIPIAKSLDITHEVSTYDQVRILINQSPGPFVIAECICRKKKKLEGGTCSTTDRMETCLAMADAAKGAIRLSVGREVSKTEALSILEQNQKEGLVLQPSNSRKAEFICSCCGCCCGMLEVHQLIPNPLRYWATNFHVTVDQTLCNGCGACSQRCQVKAIAVDEKTNSARADLSLCLGCGVCVPTCPQNALKLEKNQQEIEPPERFEDLYDEIMEKKKGPLGRIGVTMKVVYDAFRTGRTEVLKR